MEEFNKKVKEQEDLGKKIQALLKIAQKEKLKIGDLKRRTTSRIFEQCSTKSWRTEDIGAHLQNNTQVLRWEIFRSIKSVARRYKEIPRVNSAVIRPRPGPRNPHPTSIVHITKKFHRNDQTKQRFASGLQQSQVRTSNWKIPRSVEKHRRTAWRNLCPLNWFRRRIFSRRDVLENWRKVWGCGWKIERKNPVTVRPATWEPKHSTTPN